MPFLLSTDTGIVSGAPLNDSYGTATEAAGTAIRRLIYPRAEARARVSNWAYLAGATAHTLTFMTVQAKGTVQSEAASGQAVVSLNENPTTYDGTVAASGDLFALKYEDGSWAIHAFSSMSGTALTVGANFTKKVPAGSAWYFFGAEADHSSRAFYCPASTFIHFTGSDSRITACQSNMKNEPIIASSDNGTNAGRLLWLAFTYELSPT